VAPPFEVDADGDLAPPDGSGIGRTPDASVLDQFEVDRMVLTR
jgi:hypothetical protein